MTLIQPDFLTDYAAKTAHLQPSRDQLVRAYENIEASSNAEAAQAEQEALLAPRGPSPSMKSMLENVAKFNLTMGAGNAPGAPPLDQETARQPAPIVAAPVKEMISPPIRALPQPSPEMAPGAEVTPFQPGASRERLFTDIPEAAAKRDPFTAPLGYKRPAPIEPEIVAQPFADVDMKAEIMAMMQPKKPMALGKKVGTYDNLSFKKAFAAARDDGLESFAWKKKRFTTEYAKPERPSFAETRAESGFGIKKGVDETGVSSEMTDALSAIAPVWDAWGMDASKLVTSGKRSKGDWSLHETGDAIDIRFRPEEFLPGLKGADLLNQVEAIEKDIQANLPEGFFIDLSKHGTGWHLHLSQKTEASMQRLNLHGEASGIDPSEIENAVSRAKYESFLKER